MCNEDDKVVAFPGLVTGAAAGPRHKPTLSAFTEAIGHIQKASDFVRRSPVSPEDRKTMLALLAKGAGRVLQANLIYIEKVVLRDGDQP